MLIEIKGAIYTGRATSLLNGKGKFVLLNIMFVLDNSLSYTQQLRGDIKSRINQITQQIEMLEFY